MIIDSREPDERTNERTSTKTGSINPYRLLSHSSKYKAGSLIENIPGNNRLEQLKHILSALAVPLDSDYIQQEHLNGKGWLIIYFSNQSDMTTCIEQMTIMKPRILLEKIEQEGNKNPLTKYNQHKKPNEFNMSEKYQKHPSTLQNDNIFDEKLQLQIIDIPSDFTFNRIKGALKYFGRTDNIKLSTNKVKKNKSALVDLYQNRDSKSLDNVWSLPMGNVMARVAVNNADPGIFTQRNKYTARLYGINSNISSTRIMSIIKHTGAKSCYIPTNSATLRKRKYEITSY